MTGKSHRENRGEGVNFTLVGKYQYAMRGIEEREDRKNINSQYAGAGYKTKQGVVELNVENDFLLPETMTEEQSDAYIVGVIFAQHFCLKKVWNSLGKKEKR